MREGQDIMWGGGVGHGPEFGQQAAMASFQKILEEGRQIDIKSFGRALLKFDKYDPKTHAREPIPDEQKKVLSSAFESALEGCADGADVFRILTGAGYRGVADKAFLSRPEIKQKVLSIIFAEMERNSQFLQRNLVEDLGYIGIDKNFLSNQEFLQKVKETAMRWLREGKWDFVSPIVASVFEGEIDQEFLAVLEESYKKTPVKSELIGYMPDASLLPIYSVTRKQKKENFVEVFGSKITGHIDKWDADSAT
jgi:hypothetical protein